MNVFKFGGASVKDAEGVKNVATVLQQTGHANLVIVVSAMGKMTNALEGVVSCYFRTPEKVKEAIEDIKMYHITIARGIFTHASASIFKHIDTLLQELSSFLNTNKSTNHAYVYDQVVGYGELLSTAIIAAYLEQVSIKNNWIDIRTCIATDSTFRDATVDWETTQQQIIKNIPATGITITQGFLGAEATNNFTTTLGREGSDYTAAILAYCLNAASVTIWKDVPGVLNADPRYFENAQLLHQISYREAIELAFYGASVIHPKTLQPLQQKEIPLFVKSFLKPKDAGTCVGKGKTLEPKVPCFIVRKDQVLIELSSLDFSFIVEENISEIFNLLHLYKMKVDVIQNSAISFSVCVDNNYDNLEKLLLHLKAKFKVTFHKNVALYTIRHYTKNAIQQLEENKTVLLKQIYNETVQIVTK